MGRRRHGFRDEWKGVTRHETEEEWEQVRKKRLTVSVRGKERQLL